MAPGLLDTVIRKPRMLPEDVIVQILLFCEIGDILACGQACRRFASMVETNLYLRYKIELAINGMVDCYGSGLSIGERLAMLRQYRERSCGGPLEYTNTEDQFLTSREAGSRYGWHDIRDNVSVSGGPTYATIKRLLGVIDIYATPLFAQAGMRHWSVPLADLLKTDGPILEVMNVYADASQDLLLAFVRRIPQTRRITIRIRSLAEPTRSHALAAQPDIALKKNGNNVQIKDVQIEGHLLGFLLFDLAWIITVVNWHSGALVWIGTYDRYTQTFSLLGTSHIIVSRSYEAEVHRFKIPDGPIPSVAHAPTFETEHILTLQFKFESVDPKFVRGVWVKACGSPVPPPGAPFWPDPDLRVVVLMQYVQKFPREGMISALPYKDLRRLIERAEYSRADPTMKEVLPWEAWSKYSLNLTFLPYNDISCSFGSRMPIHVWDRDEYMEEDDFRDVYVVVVDLNPWAARHARKEPSEEAARAQWEVNQAAFKHFEKCYAVDSTNGPLYSVCRMPPTRYTDSTPHLVMDHNGYTVIYVSWNFTHPGFESFFVTV